MLKTDRREHRGGLASCLPRRWRTELGRVDSVCPLAVTRYTCSRVEGRWETPQNMLEREIKRFKIRADGAGGRTRWDDLATRGVLGRWARGLSAETRERALALRRRGFRGERSPTGRRGHLASLLPSASPPCPLVVDDEHIP